MATAAPVPEGKALGRGGAGYSASESHAAASVPHPRITRAMKLRALRGAITVDENESTAILSATEELVREVMERNALDPDDMVSCIFTCTEDLDAEFPAVAARSVGLSSVPLLCAREIPVPGALPRVIRLMLHCYADPDTPAQHVYLRDAVALRRDLQGAQ
jgi:chorismate mutase